MPTHDHDLESLCAAIFDARQIDWDCLFRKAAHDQGRTLLLRTAQILATIETAHRRLRFGESDDLPFPSWRHLHLLERLSEGAYGEFYRAWDEALGREVGLKLYRTTPVEMLERVELIDEARRLARISHENVVSVHGVDVDHNRVGFWMELVRGETLSETLAREGRLDSQRTIEIGIALARALTAAHAAGVTHGDIKPGNVLIESGGRIFLIDFGAGRATDGPVGFPRRVGTPLFMAPETLLDGESSERSDLYSLGALMFFALTGHYPIAAQNLPELWTVHEERARRAGHTNLIPMAGKSPLPRIPRALKQIVQRCLAADPASRPADAKTVEAELQSVARAPHARHRRAVIVLAATAVLMAGLFAGTQQGVRSPQGSQLGCVDTFFDDFADGILGPHWRTSSPDCGKPREENGTLVTSRLDGCSGPSTLESNFAICGDFDIRVDFEIVDLPMPERGWNVAGFEVWDGDRLDAGIDIFRTSPGDCVPSANCYKAFVGVPDDCLASWDRVEESSGTLRITRSAEVARLYYWRHGWIQLHEAPVEVNPVRVYLRAGAGGLYNPSSIEVRFDNLVIRPNTARASR
jgi:tRNA A-37 threonylcarbamoyl transferase component Bud32